MVEKNLDFRSDTVTRPTPEMREAMYKADLGDDVYGDDPNVNELERLSAEIIGKEAGVFVTSGTQGNACAILALTSRGDEIILERRSHIYNNEVGGLAVMGQLMPRTIMGVEGWMRPEDLRKELRPWNIHYPDTSLICVENTHNSAGGIPLTASQMKSNWDIAKEHDLNLHLDGARIFNAAIALGVDVKELTKYADTIQFCLSKGLSAPVGSVVVGPKEIVEKARKYRKMLGGGMRQAGVIAAPGIVALKTMIDRLSEDHENAKLLSDGLKELGFKILYPVRTNMTYIDYSVIGWSAQDFIQNCEKIGWKARATGNSTRLCTHYGIEKEDIESFLDGLKKFI